MTEPHELILNFLVYSEVLGNLGGKGHAANVVYTAQWQCSLYGQLL